MAPLDRRSAAIKTLVVDDESWARRNLTVLLRRDPDIESIVECGSGSEEIEEIRKSKPDLVFLDVQMPGCGGFDVLELLGIPLLGVIPESKAVLQSSNKGTPAILDETTDVAQAYLDVVFRYLGQERQHRFIEEEKRGFFGRLFG